MRQGHTNERKQRKVFSAPVNEDEAFVILSSAGDPNAASSSAICRYGPDRRHARRKEHPMLDVIVLAIAFAFFALSVGYTIACDRL